MVKATRRALLALPLMAAAPAPITAWDFSFPALEGGGHDLATWRGKVLLVVNTASFCGFTGQYAALQRLYEAQEAAGMVVLGVPSNDFNQESQDGRKIREFCDAQFGITFPMAALSRVKGPGAHPFYRWAAAQAGGEPGIFWCPFILSFNSTAFDHSATAHLARNNSNDNVWFFTFCHRSVTFLSSRWT